MRKTLLFVFALLFATATMAQNRAMFINESFDSQTMPQGWSIMGLGTTNWSISASNNAGGQANELHMGWSPQFNGISRVVMPAVDLTGVSGVTVSFRHNLDNYQGSSTIGIATSSDDGTTWNVGWSQAYSSNGTWTVSQQITTADMGQANVRFCLYYSGNSYNMNDWYFDDIQIFTLENLDLGITSINVNSYVPSGELNIGFDVKSFGSTIVTDVEAVYEVEGFEPVTETFTVNITSLATTTINFNTPISLSPDAYNLTISLNTVNGAEDDDTGNNTLSKSFNVALADAERIPMIEHFSSSTCSPCVSPNNMMHTFCNNNPGRFTYTKYQMNWPGSGDPYYTEEGGTRRGYYGINAVPMAFMDAESLNFGTVQNQFNQHAEIPAFMDIKGSFSVDGDNISVIADIMPYVDVNARVYVSVNEKETHGNVGSNGETTFHHIFMKMLPNAQGTTVDFVAGELQRLEFTQNMTGTHVEEMSDLEVSIWVQNYDSKTIFNSRFAYEYTEVHPYPIENLILADYTTSNGTMVATWDAPTEANPVGYNVYLNGELVAENITENTYSFESQADVFYVIGVVALYDGDMSSVKVVATPTVVLQDLGLVAENVHFVLDDHQPITDVHVTNANAFSQADINILSIEEANEEDVQYLTITCNELPFVLPYDEDFVFTIEPNYLGEEKSTAHTKIYLTSDAGTLEFEVEIDGEVLNITEVSAETKIYPNPASSNVRIEAENGIESVKVYNILGALVETIPANAKSVNVNLDNYSDGVYFFNVRQNDGTVSNQRVVVSH